MEILKKFAFFVITLGVLIARDGERGLGSDGNEERTPPPRSATNPSSVPGAGWGQQNGYPCGREDCDGSTLYFGISMGTSPDGRRVVLATNSLEVALLMSMGRTAAAQRNGASRTNACPGCGNPNCLGGSIFAAFGGIPRNTAAGRDSQRDPVNSSEGE